MLSSARVVRLIALAVAPGVALIPRPAHADTTSSLSWIRLDGAAACVGAPELARRVEERLGRRVLVPPSEAQLSIEGHVEPHRRGWRAVVVLAGATGEVLSERSLETREASCRALDDALVLVIALSLDPSGAPPAPPPPEATPRVIVREVVREIHVRQPWHLGVRGGLELELGVLPRPAPAAAVAIVIEAPGLPPIELAGFAYAGAHADASLEGRGVDVGLIGGGAAACPRVADLGVELGVCVGLRLGWTTWAGQGFERPASGGVLVPAATADARLALPLGAHVSAVLGAGVRLPFRRVSVAYEGSTPGARGDEVLFQAQAASLWTSLGLVVSIF